MNAELRGALLNLDGQLGFVNRVFNIENMYEVCFYTEHNEDIHEVHKKYKLMTMGMYITDIENMLVNTVDGLPIILDGLSSDKMDAYTSCSYYILNLIPHNVHYLDDEFNESIEEDSTYILFNRATDTVEDGSMKNMASGYIGKVVRVLEKVAILHVDSLNVLLMVDKNNLNTQYPKVEEIE